MLRLATVRRDAAGFRVAGFRVAVLGAAAFAAGLGAAGLAAGFAAAGFVAAGFVADRVAVLAAGFFAAGLAAGFGPGERLGAGAPGFSRTSFTAATGPSAAVEIVAAAAPACSAMDLASRASSAPIDFSALATWRCRRPSSARASLSADSTFFRARSSRAASRRPALLSGEPASADLVDRVCLAIVSPTVRVRLPVGRYRRLGPDIDALNDAARTLTPR